MSRSRIKVELTCQQCGVSIVAAAIIEIDSYGNRNRHISLPDGWMPLWVPDDEKAKMTCGDCQSDD